MGCGSGQHVTAPIGNAEKWSDEVTVVISNSRLKQVEFSLCTENSFIVVSSTSFTSQPYEVPVVECGLIFLRDLSIMIAGGCNKFTNKDSEKCYILKDLTTLTEISPIVRPTRRLRLLQYEDFIYCIGGVREVEDTEIHLEYCNNFARYDNEGKWEVLKDMITGVEYPGCHAYSDKIFVVGGCFVNGLDLEVVDSVQVYNIKESKWENFIAFMPAPVYGLITVPIDSSSFLLIGGIDSTGEPNSMGYIIGRQDAQEISAIPNGISMFFPYTSAYDGGKVCVVNDQKEILLLNRLERKWNIMKSTGL